MTRRNSIQVKHLKVRDANRKGWENGLWGFDPRHAPTLHLKTDRRQLCLTPVKFCEQSSPIPDGMTLMQHWIHQARRRAMGSVKILTQLFTERKL
jgi:hypothetical protein